MLNPEKLRAVTTIVCHRNPEIPCPDGVASALILRSALSGLEIRFVAHGAELLSLPATPGMLFCDIAPAESRAADFRAAGAMVLDHHRSHRAVVESFGVDGVYADEKTEPGVSGAVLAFREVWMPLRGVSVPDVYRERDAVEKLARLAGIRDTWQRSSPDWRAACEQAETLIFWPWTAWPVDFSTSYAATRMWDIGPVLLERREARTRQLLELGIRTKTRKGTRVLIVPSRETSDVAELAGDSADLVVGFGYGKSEDHLPTLILSTRSHAGYDCAAFCKAHGGGGHTAAAGFHVDLSWEDGQPHAMIQSLLEEHERGGA